MKREWKTAQDQHRDKGLNPFKMLLIMLATWKPHSGELSQADTAANMHFLQVSNDYINLSLSINGISRRDPTICRADKILLQEGSILLLRLPVNAAVSPMTSGARSFIHSFKHKHFLNICSTWPRAVTETWKWVRQSLAFKGLAVHWETFLSAQRWWKWEGLSQSTRDNGEVIIWGSGRLHDVDAV